MIAPRPDVDLRERKLWRQAAEAILALDAVHPRAQELFVEVWYFLDGARKEFGGDDDLYFALLRKVSAALRRAGSGP